MGNPNRDSRGRFPSGGGGGAPGGPPTSTNTSAAGGVQRLDSPKVGDGKTKRVGKKEVLSDATAAELKQKIPGSTI